MDSPFSILHLGASEVPETDERGSNGDPATSASAFHPDIQMNREWRQHGRKFLLQIAGSELS